MYLFAIPSYLGINSSQGSSGSSLWGTVVEEKLLDVTGKDDWIVNNLHDEKLPPRLAQRIVEKARSCVGKDVQYSIDKWNSEHFATWCRYGKPESLQVCKWIYNLELASDRFVLFFTQIYHL